MLVSEHDFIAIDLIRTPVDILVYFVTILTVLLEIVDRDDKLVYFKADSLQGCTEHYTEVRR